MLSAGIRRLPSKIFCPLISVLRFSNLSHLRCKQLVTLGPSSNTLESIRQLVEEGADIFRLNFSHGNHEEKSELVKLIRQIEEEYKKPFAILADLQGPKLRIGKFVDKKVTLEGGQLFRFDKKDEPGDKTRVCLPHPEIMTTLNTDDIVLLDDGKLKLKVISVDGGGVDCIVLVGGPLSDKKGVNTPSILLPISPLTTKDRVDVEHALSLGVDWVALSFVQKAQDVVELQTLVQGRAKVMAKLEKPQAISDMNNIIKTADAVMVARGDLGVEMNPEEVPVVQKMVMRCGHSLGTPVVIATQMLESMIHAPTPTRAEASDVATAVYDGADAIMLSAESANGKFPVEAVAMQQKIIRSVENSAAYKAKRLSEYRDTLPRFTSPQAAVTMEAIMKAARDVAGAVRATAIISFTVTGDSILREAAARPLVPIIAATPRLKTARYLQLVWGVEPLVIPSEDLTSPTAFKHMMFHACERAVAAGLIKKDDIIVLTAGLPFGGNSSNTNYLRVMTGAGPEILVPGEEESTSS